MRTVPIICIECGESFQYPLGVNVENFKKDIEIVPCPECGYRYNLPGDFFELVDRAVEVLSVKEITIDELNSYVSLVRQVPLRGVGHYRALARRIHKTRPEIYQSMSFLRDKDVQTWATVILTAITIILSQLSDKPADVPEVKPVETSHNITVNIEEPVRDGSQPMNDGGNYEINVNVNVNDQSTQTENTIKQPTNSKEVDSDNKDYCPCGSGLEHKDCHAK